MPTCPVAIFIPGTTAKFARNTKPLLFMAIISVAAAGECTPDHHRKFALEARNFLAGLAIFEGEKSLQLIQALLVVSFWYRAPENYARTNQNQLASVTLSMAIDIGLDRIEESNIPQKVDDQWNRAEAQRTWLGCFLLCSSLSLIMRRANPMKWTPQLGRYLDDLRQSKLSSTDEFFCDLLTTEHSCYVANEEFLLSDPSNSVSLWGPDTLSVIQRIKDRANGVSLRAYNFLQKSLFEFGKLASSLYAYEIVLHVNHNIDEFKAPFSANSLKSLSFFDKQNPHNTYLLVIRKIMQDAQRLLDTFMHLSTSEILALPPHIYAGRVIYAVILLMKLHKAASTYVNGLNEEFSVETLRLEDYIERLTLVSKPLGAEDPYNSLSRAFLIMPQLKEWLQDHMSQSKIEKDEHNLQKETLSEDSIDPVPASINRQESSQSLPREADGRIYTLTGSSNILGAPESQSENQFTQSEASENPAGILGRELVSDSWFWEFFNVDMLH
ncbi:hypothetical protein N7478_000203 [Penicillium angulare]|uniref:uncharacterized protein n=1 Tax=Penicillium angulare TaxID=116970 RepID=UPI002540730E|nr:uncharacterized protein N7478_000203 [Penicillium angulare]KAJ5290952.1 hypothetical protein N7478_000203 [Penicillium angulare]